MLHALFSLATAATTPPMGLVYPLYVYPLKPALEGIYTQVASARSRGITLYVIINPGNGDAVSCPANSDWQPAIDLLRQKGVRTIGYVHSSYAHRPLSAYEPEIDKYLDCWQTEGIFVDEVSSDAKDIPHYQQLFDYVKGKESNITGSRPSVWLNPGTSTDEGYMNVSDVIWQFESPLAAFEKYTPPPYLGKYPATRTGMMVLDVPEQQTMEGILMNVSAMNAAWTIVLSVPYTSAIAPAYWDQEAAFVQKHFSPAPPPVTPAPSPSPHMSEIPLFHPGRVPGERADHPYNESWDRSHSHVYNVGFPTLTPFLVPHSTAAVLINPGGAYEFLSWALEGTTVAAWLNSLNISAFILKYRVPGRSWLPFGGAPLMDAQRAVGIIRQNATA